jgi:hypothetical protein
MQFGGTVWCSCADLDNKERRPDLKWRTKAERIYRLLAEHQIPPLVEISQSGSAAHAWLFFEQPTPAWAVRAFWGGALTAAGIAVPEIYPRQDQLSGKGLGNLIRYPLWNQSHFVDVTAGWAPLEPIRALSQVVPATLGQLQAVAARVGFALAPTTTNPARTEVGVCGEGALPPRVRVLLEEDQRLAARWGGSTDGLTDTSRSAVVMSLACLLINRYVPTPEVEAAIRCWCAARNYAKGLREDWVRLVLENAYDFVGRQSALRHRDHERARPPSEVPELIRRAYNRVVSERVAQKLANMKGDQHDRPRD